MSEAGSQPHRRFSNRVEHYVKFRPGYPRAIVDDLQKFYNLSSDSVVAECGSGTGLFLSPFLDLGCSVFAVEPNESMRCAAEEIHTKSPNYNSVNGSAENLNLPDSSVDFLFAAQAFHWFDRDAFCHEMKKVLRPGGVAGLAWNVRQLDSTPFLSQYESCIKKHSTDYESIRHDKITAVEISSFFSPGSVEKKSYQNFQKLNFEGLVGRCLSASYLPSEYDPSFPALYRDLEILFDKENQGGEVCIQYETVLYLSLIN